jgi:hypothetical protein
MPSKETEADRPDNRGEGEGDSAGNSSMLGIHQNIKRRRTTAGLLLVVVGLVEEEIGGELFVLVAGEVCLDDGIPGEA